MSSQDHATHHHPPAAGGAIDPVCGMTVDPARAAGQTEYKGQTYYFCARSCLSRFEAEPERFLAPRSPQLLQIGKPSAQKPVHAPRDHAPVTQAAQPASPPTGTSGTTYVCPMDPEVRQTRPGACPKCGMAL